jgi:hypothetical protein
MKWFIEGKACSPKYALDPSPLPPLPHGKTEKGRQLADGRGVEDGGGGSKSYGGKIVWSSLYHDRKKINTLRRGASGSLGALLTISINTL